jgi:hypothetical protein
VYLSSDRGYQLSNEQGIVPFAKFHILNEARISNLPGQLYPQPEELAMSLISLLSSKNFSKRNQQTGDEQK